ncbi:MAG: type II secretion system F family protein [Methanocorpusculum sp.]|nr:type II secretion system F family protein [Methanocorpusculum sp.]
MYARKLLFLARVAAIVAFVLVIVIVVVFDTVFYTVASLLTDPDFAFYVIPLTLIIAFAIGFGVYYVILSYPRFEMGSRARRIEASMYDMITYVYALHHSGASLYATLSSIAKYADYYGDAAKEFRQVVSDVEFCGYDPYSALKRLTDTTPSDKFRFFLSEYTSTYRSIGTVEAFLKDKVEEMHEEHRVQQKAYLASLGAVAEMYITLFVAGPLFVVIVIMVMGMISNPDPTILALVVYAMLPMGTVVFLLLIDTLGQTYIIERKDLPKFIGSPYPHMTLMEASRDEDYLYDAIDKYDKGKKLRDFIDHPMDSIRENPSLTFIFTVPLAILTFALAYVFLVGEPVPALFPINTDYVAKVDDCIVVFFVTLLIPYAIFYGMRKKKYARIEDALPDFSRQLGSSIRHNMTLAKAIEMAGVEGKSYIREDILTLHRDIEWGERVSIAIRHFSDRLKTLAVDRLVILVSETEHFATNISNTLFLVYSEAKDALMLKNERKSDMAVYTVIVYMAFLVFVFVQIIMSEVFLELMATTGTISVGSTVSTAAFPVGMYRMIITHSVLIHGFCSGLVAGMMGEGDTKAGIKHACIMLVLGSLAFFVADIILPMTGLLS